jgi:glycerol uptake facilitator-like aquaporin
MIGLFHSIKLIKYFEHFCFLCAINQVPAYLGAQITGAIASAFVLRLILNNDASEGASLPAGSNAQSLILEIIITFILMFVISAVATDTRAVSYQTCTQFQICVIMISTLIDFEFLLPVGSLM